MRLPFGRLFWKLFATFGLATLLGVISSILLLQLSLGGPKERPPAWVPLVPLSLGLLFALLAGLIAAWYLSRPLRHLRQALREAAQARFEVRVAPMLGNRNDEIADLGREFDHMAQRLQDALLHMQRLFHDISHELRSPLARLQAAIGLMQQDPQQAGLAIERIKREAQRLDALVEELLTLHKLETGTTGPARERVDVIELLAAIVEDADFEARSRGCGVQLRGAESFVAEVNGELIYRAFENVIRNAVKYTAPGTTVEVNAGIREGVLEVSVQDRGPGVPAELCEEIFLPFRRLENGRTDAPGQNIPGTGLGLAIARRALILHGGSIRAEPRGGGGLCVVSTLPAGLRA